MIIKLIQLYKYKGLKNYLIKYNFAFTICLLKV